VGDSRAYRLRGGQFTQITRDHSLLQEQLDAGLLTPEEAAYSSNRNLVTRAVGVEDTVMLELHAHEVQPGDLFMLCSDGLSDMLDDDALAQLLINHPSLPEAAQALIAAANDMGGKDNIAIVLARAEGRVKPASRTWWPFGRR
jgi:protein phosphatase